jgi:hypothetical protein
MDRVVHLVRLVLHQTFQVISFDEVPYQIVSKTRLPLAIRNGKPGMEYLPCGFSRLLSQEHVQLCGILLHMTHVVQ